MTKKKKLTEKDKLLLFFSKELGTIHHHLNFIRDSIRERDQERHADKGPERPRCGSPTFYALLEEMADTHDKKSHDYATNASPFGNYEFAGFVATMFAHSPLDAGFAGRLAEKMYRLSVLEGGQKIPLNESIADTERDIAVIVTLWMAARKDRASQAANQSSKTYQSSQTETASASQADSLWSR